MTNRDQLADSSYAKTHSVTKGSGVTTQLEANTDSASRFSKTWKLRVRFAYNFLTIIGSINGYHKKSTKV